MRTAGEVVLVGSLIGGNGPVLFVCGLWASTLARAKLLKTVALGRVVGEDGGDHLPHQKEEDHEHHDQVPAS